MVGIILSLLLVVKPAVSGDGEVAPSCIKIVKQLAPPIAGPYLRLTAYAQYQKDLNGTTTLTSPTHAGLRLEIPLLDPRERLERQREYVRALDFARRLLADYLKLRYEVEEMKRFVQWQWARVEAGIEYRKDVWKEEVALKQKEGELKALTALLLSAGIPKELLQRCYEEGLKEDRP